MWRLKASSRKLREKRERYKGDFRWHAFVSHELPAYIELFITGRITFFCAEKFIFSHLPARKVTHANQVLVWLIDYQVIILKGKLLLLSIIIFLIY